VIKTKIVRLALEWDWQDGVTLPGPRDRATFARLRIAAGGQPITLVSHDGHVQDGIDVALYPLAEWVAENWWSLIADARPGTMISQLRFAYKRGVVDQRAPWVRRSRRHVVRAAGDGYHWPDLLIVPEGRQTRITWTPDGDGAPATRYLTTGNALVESAAFTVRLAQLVHAVVARLDAAGLTGTPLHEAWSAVRSADAETAEFCRLTAQLGLDPYVDADAYRDDIVEVAGDLPSSMLFDFFNGVSRNRLLERRDWP